MKSGKILFESDVVNKQIVRLIKAMQKRYAARARSVFLCGHSGRGGWIFACLTATPEMERNSLIPAILPGIKP